MTSDPPLATDQVQDCFNQYKNQQFTGKVELSSPRSLRSRSFYFCVGRLFWATDGQNDNRRLIRCLGRFCPQIKQHKFALRQTDSFESQNYNLLVILLHRKTITQEQFCDIINEVLMEVLFDVIQEQVTQTKPDQASPLMATETPYEPLAILKIASTPVNGERALTQAQAAWQSWDQAKLITCSPNAGLILRDGATLQAKLPPEVYQKLATAMDGRRTVRDLAGLMQKDPVVVLKSLWPYLSKGAIDLLELEDAPPLIIPPTETGAPSRDDSDRRHSQTKINPKAPIVACIDDSPQICALMERTIADAGYQPLCIQDSTQALPKLLENKPSLIFLDLIMPVANGYEICSQIRRIASFKDVPVAILTGSDGIVDRVRAKVVGATDFISKPIDPEKIQTVLKRYLESADGSPRLVS